MSLDYATPSSTSSARPGGERLAALATRVPHRISARGMAAVFAHPDDETIACGAQLGRMDGAFVVTVTDGAPRNLHDAHRLHFASAANYAAARQLELAAALTIAGVEPKNAIGLGVPDQEAATRLAQISRALANLFAELGIHTVITHAYEGGHPDHDATAFCVHSAAELQRRDRHRTTVIEAPLYRLNEQGTVRQEFARNDAADPGELVLQLTAGQRDLKRRMMDAHRTQCQVLAPFQLGLERFRTAPAYDFAGLPNGGRLLYEGYPWGLDGRRWVELVRAARAELHGAGGAPC